MVIRFHGTPRSRYDTIVRTFKPFWVGTERAVLLILRLSIVVKGLEQLFLFRPPPF